MRFDDRESFVTVFSTRNAAIIALAKSVLDAAGIRYFAWGDTTNALFGSALVGLSASASVVKIQVLQSVAEHARELLKELSEPDS